MQHNSPEVRPTRQNFWLRLASLGLILSGLGLGGAVGLHWADDYTHGALRQRIAQWWRPSSPPLLIRPAFASPRLGTRRTLPPPTLRSRTSRTGRASVSAPSGPTVTPPTPSLPPLRIEIPTIRLAAEIVPVSPVTTTLRNGDTHWAWPAPDYVVGHLDRSALPGAGGNIVLAGHNNIRGEVFRDLDAVAPGAQIVLHTAEAEHRYVVREVTIVPYKRDPAAGEAILQAYMAATTRERLTLLSCFPYIGNEQRIVVVAEPSLALAKKR